jgi:HlyD family secretion protein
MSHRTVLTAGLILALGVGAAWIYFDEPEPVGVIVTRVEVGQVQSTVTNTRAGTVKACRRAQLSPSIGGQIARLWIKEGDRVQRGQVLIEIWNEDRQAQYSLATREAKAYEARAEEACATAEVAEHEATRLIKLQVKGLASDEAIDQAVGQAKAKSASCKAARANTLVSEAKIEVAAAALEITHLYAPFSGTVAEINGEEGEYVTPSPIGIPTPPTIDLIDHSCLYVAAPIDEVDAPEIRAGMPALITLDAFKDSVFPGHVRRVAPYIMDREKQARTVDIEVEFDTPPDTERLLPGYSADVEVVLATREKVLRVPTEALLEGYKVLIFEAEDGTLTETSVEAGLSNWKFTEIAGGLEPGQQIVLSIDRDGVEDGATAQPE